MRRLTCSLLVGLSILVMGCGGKIPPSSGNANTVRQGNISLPRANASPVRHGNPRYDLWNHLIQNDSNIILRVRDNSAAAQGSSIGYIEVNHTDSNSGETCRITASEFQVGYCCIDMLL